MELAIGIDLGTSSIKAVAIDPFGRVHSKASRDYDILSPHKGWAEQDPETWFQKSLEVIQEMVLSGNIDPNQIRSIGFSGQMHGTVLIDENLKLMRHAIIWADRRSQNEVDWIREKIGFEKLRKWVGNPIDSGFMLPTLLWLKENESTLWKQIRFALLPKDYLRFRYTGNIGSEYSDASSTGLLDPFKRKWSEEVCESFGLELDSLPPLFESAEVSGVILPKLAKLLGIGADVKVVFGGSDQACQAIGNGVISPGQICMTIGTGGQVFCPIDEPAADELLRYHLFCHAIPDRWHFQTSILSAGLTLKWLRDKIFEGKSYQDLANLAEASPVGANGAFFLPHLLGERTPYMDPNSRGVFIGLSLQNNRSDMIRAVMEGVVYSLKLGLELIVNQERKNKKWIFTGGSAENELWRYLVSGIMGHPILVRKTVFPAAFGSAILSLVGTGKYQDVEAACENTIVECEEICIPNSDDVLFYEKQFKRFKQIYPLTRKFNIPH
ncbi:MAG: xylulokinase [Anaerolineaceae bacterium]|nr:xylulokinase [Anaerolineaceae bacterium]